jgi:hypothetical protein
MTEPRAGRDSRQHENEPEVKPIEYPTDCIVGILDTPEQASCALDGLIGGGFLESEIEILHGPEEAERLEASTGRGGFQDWWIRVFHRLGLENAETEMKERYERALRDGHTVVSVLAPSEERKDRAVELLRQCDGHFINFFGRINVQRIAG